MDISATARLADAALAALQEGTRNHLRAALLPGERILWIGQAVSRRVLRNAAWRTVGALLGLAFAGPVVVSLGASIALLLQATGSSFSGVGLVTMGISVLFFIAFGLGCLHALSRLLSLHSMPLEARHSACVVTSQRALIVRADSWGVVMSTQAFTPEQLQDAFVVKADARCSNVVFRREWIDAGEGEYAKDTGFMFLADVAPAVQALRSIGAEVDDSGRPPARHRPAEVRPAAPAPAAG